jgi:L-aspartate oxidase
LAQAHSDPNIEIVTHYFAIDLITQHHLGEYVDKNREDITCYGIYAFNTSSHLVDQILSKVTVMASGGPVMFIQVQQIQLSRLEMV